MGEKYLLEFELKGLTRMTNALNVHWRVRHSHTTRWKNLTIMAAREKGVPEEPLTKATLTLTRFSAKEPDFDGLVSSFKAVVDGLRDAGVILDDKPSVVGNPSYAWVYAKPNHGKIKIKVESA